MVKLDPGPSSISVCKRPVLETSGASLAKMPHFESRIETCQGGRKSTGGSVSA